MAYPDSVVVSARGELLVGLSDGQIINAGRVTGPAGPRGESGLVGLRGEPGIDGLSCIAAFKAPSQDDGKEGDSWIDCSSAEFSFYIKSGNGWDKITTLRQPAPDLRMGVAGGGAGTGTGGGGGSGGGAEVHVGPEAPAFPSVGELWFDTNDDDGRMYVWTGDGWQPVLPQPDLDGYAKVEYVDAKTAALPYLIETDKVLREGKADVRSGEAEIQLVDNQDNYSNVRFAGTNGVDVTSTASSIVIDGSKLSGDITAELTNFATIAYSDSKDADLQNQIDDLSVSRGKVARYKVENTNDTPVARSGELATNTSFQPNVTRVSFGIEDLDGVLTKPMSDGDIIDFVDSTTEKLSRYRIGDASGAPTIVAVTYVSGDADFARDEIKQVYIYPQNQAGASKEYVDAQDDLKLDKAGGTVTGPLITDGILTIKGNATYFGNMPDEYSLVTRKYVDNAVSTGGDFLPITGGKMLGNIEFEGSSQIKAKGTSNLDGRASLVISGASDKPVAVDSGSSYLPALSIFGYDASQPNNRKQVIDFKANGRIDTVNSVVSQELFKSTRSTGYAFEAKPGDSVTSSFIHTNGSAQFANNVEILKTKTTDHEGFVIYGTVADGTEGKILQSFHNSDPLPDAVNYLGKVEQPKNIVNKGYVDAIAAAPARLAWKWDKNASGSSGPAAGKFYFDGDYLRLSFETANGVFLNDNLIGDTGSTTVSYGPMLTVWYLNPTSYKWRFMRAMRIESYRWNYNNHFEFEESSARGITWSSLVNNTQYYLTAGGFF